MTYLGWLKVCFLSLGEQYVSFGTHKPSVEQFLKKKFFLPNCAIFDIFTIWVNFIYLGASICIIPCSAGQYASFGVPHTYKVSKCQIFEKSKKGVASSVFLPIWGSSKYVF